MFMWVNITKNNDTHDGLWYCLTHMQLDRFVLQCLKVPIASRKSDLAMEKKLANVIIVNEL